MLLLLLLFLSWATFFCWWSCCCFSSEKDKRRLSSADDEPNSATNSFIHSTLHCILINYHVDATLSLVQIVVVYISKYILFNVACAVCSIENSVAHGELFKSTENPQVLAFVCSIRHNAPRHSFTGCFARISTTSPTPEKMMMTIRNSFKI